mmetsp:Transcript_18510/g.26145  ORF Transcript_18510/g.26145 Transcript_18510/m.26145 type:complete len:258 (+) Transcript_18510:180-953(+)
MTDSLISELTTQVNNGDVDGGMSTLAKLKIAMMDFPEPLSQDHLQIATSALELGVLLSVADGDLDGFARHVAQLKPYYSFHSDSSFSSERKCHVLGLNLMYLLVENRLSEFHAELELLTVEQSQSKYITFPIQLERQLMVGAYDQVLTSATQVPDTTTYTTLFMENLLQTVRDSIADCLEVSYSKMTLEDAVQMMKLSNSTELKEYIEECRDDWILSEDGTELLFQPPPTGLKSSDIPSMKLISQSLTYATEMDRIV